MSVYRNGEIGEAIGDVLDHLAELGAAHRERRIYVEHLRLLCELAVLRGETCQPADDRGD